MQYKWQITRSIDNETVVEYVIKDNPDFTHEDWMGEEGLYTYEVIDVTDADLEARKTKWEDDCIAGGVKAKGRFNRLLSKYEYGDTEQEFFMTDTDFQLVDYLLNHGALNKTIGLLTMKDPVSYYTENFKNDFIAIVQAISDEIGNEPV